MGAVQRVPGGLLFGVLQTGMRSLAPWHPVQARLGPLRLPSSAEGRDQLEAAVLAIGAAVTKLPWRRFATAGRA
jgi:hypothetical protein